MGVFEALGQSYSDDDLAAFQSQYNLPRQKISKIVGPNDPSSCSSDPNNCVEATLDVEYIMAMAQGAPMTFWSIADENGDIFLEWIKAVSKASAVPQVFSISYGGPEHLQDKGDMTLFSNEVCKMGLRGMTVFVASGDDGVAGYEARNDKSKCGFKPEYPANVPYVTTVGATMGPALNPPRDEEVCMSNKGSIITSGGGFSDHFDQPTWQTAAVQTYLSTGPNIPPKSMFGTGRGYPDVASLGNAYNIVVGGQWFQVSGTSAASPVFCGMVALVNGDREQAGKNPIGYLNPILYKVDKSVYNDVSDGVNNCCAGGDGSPVCCKYGFSAAKGWDPATGWGSLDYPLFAQAIANLP
jgi:tripeptidyl-peptidase-1